MTLLFIFFIGAAAGAYLESVTDIVKNIMKKD